MAGSSLRGQGEQTPLNAGSASAHPVLAYDVLFPSTRCEGCEEANVPVTFRASPGQLLLRDAALILKNAWLIPMIFKPRPTGGETDAAALLKQVALVLISLPVTVLALTSFIAGVPMPILWFALLGAFTFVVIRTQVTLKPAQQEPKYANETWLFVNGVATSSSGLQAILNYLHREFGRSVIGVHNRTFGIWFDLVECMIQRDLSWPTTDVRVGYEVISQAVRDPSKKRVVLMSHSQGGLIASIWADQLLSDFSSAELRKVEFYTFASAANHFCVPDGDDGKPTFGRVEHFANTLDFVSRIGKSQEETELTPGILNFAPPPPADCSQHNASRDVPSVAGRFAGRIFERVGHSGHLFLSHYVKAGDSILDDPIVQQHSWLQRYRNGQGGIA